MANILFYIRLLIVSGLFLLSGQIFAQQPTTQCDNKHFLQVQQNYETSYGIYHKQDVPVHICGRVITTLYARHTRSGLHGYFYLNVGSGISIRIVNNLDEMNAPAWPWVKKGDYVEVVGRYYYDNPRRQGVDWTHKGRSRKWPYAGYVVVNGVKYN